MTKHHASASAPINIARLPNPTGGAPPYIRGVPAKIPTWGFAHADIKQCTTQNETAIIFPKEEFMVAYYSASLEAFRKTNSEEVVGVFLCFKLLTFVPFLIVLYGFEEA
jgi:hypothetical protein